MRIESGHIRCPEITGRIHTCGRWFTALLMAAWVFAPAPALAAGEGSNPGVRLSGHVLPALDVATRIDNSGSSSISAQAIANAPVTLTVTLRRDDQAGFDEYLNQLYDPTSPSYKHFLAPREVSDRFGPSVADYQTVRSYFVTNGFQVVEDSANRLTLTISGSPAKTEQALSLRLHLYQLAGATFRANDRDPSLPASVVSRVMAITGLNDLARPQHINQTFQSLDRCVKNEKGIYSQNLQLACAITFGMDAAIYDLLCAADFVVLEIDVGGFSGALEGAAAGKFFTLVTGCHFVYPGHPVLPFSIAGGPLAPATIALPGTGQKIGLVEYDTYHTSDVADFLAFMGFDSDELNQLSEVRLDGGATLGAGESEVLLDIDQVMSVAPGAQTVVYDAPFTAGPGFQAMFNQMLNDGATVISNSWTYCEDQTNLADVTSLDAVLETLAMSGVTVFNGSGDTGSTCLDGGPNTIGVPADSPHATAVGGSSLSADIDKIPLFTTETWWNGADSTPATGQGGFGVSRFFARPSYQDGLNGSAYRSIPDVVAAADPAADGKPICQADNGGCPNGLLYGGTSVSAPLWAAMIADVNAGLPSNVGFLNSQIYALGGTRAFHSAAQLSSDFAHVGLGSPNIAFLYAALDGFANGTVNAANTVVAALPSSVHANGSDTATVIVQLVDSNNLPLPGKTIGLAANSGSHAIITQLSAVTNTDNGAATFSVTDSTVESVTLTPTDETDAQVLATTMVDFVVPPAASGSIVAFTDAVPADGTSTDTITVTLQDAIGRPTPGKIVTLAQTGNSVISGPSSGVTDNNGEIAFTVTDTVQETITYTATDVTDGNLPVPGSAAVTFSAGGGDNCGITNLGNPDVSAGPGYAITPFAIGFVPLDTNFGGLIDGCRGASGLAFDSVGNLYVSDLHSGNIYKFGLVGGAVGPATLITPAPLGPGIESLAFGTDEKLYGAQNATTGNFLTGAVIEINPVTGALVRTVAPSITCASFLATDPASGDLLVNDSCAGGGSENGSIWRITNPGSAAPITTIYASTPGVNGGLSFAPGGTLYMLSYRDNGGLGGVVSITGTASQDPGQITVLPGIVSPNLGIAAVGSQGNGDAQSLVLAASPGTDGFPLGIRSYDITADPAMTTALQMQNGYANVQVIGPDGCMYASMSVAVYKITNADGSCPLNVAQPLVTLSPSVISPNPTQGSEQTFTASFHNVSVPAGVSVQFQVSGVNPQVKVVNTDASGSATLTYAGVNAGNDTVGAVAIVSNTTLASNPAQVAWNPGPHTTFLNLNLSPGGAMARRPITLVASLLDVSVNPNVGVPGATIGFSVDGQSCTAVTASNGVASCSLTIRDVGAFTLTVTYAGDANHLPVTTSAVFSTTPYSDIIFQNGFEE